MKNTITFSFSKEHDYKPVLRDILLDCPEGPGVPYGEKKRKIFEMNEDEQLQLLAANGKNQDNGLVQRIC